jgi:diguanylate cyclase (GGDEF)-like protein
VKGYDFRRTFGVAGIVAILTALLVGVAVLKLRGDALDEARRDVSGLTAMLGEQVQQSAQAIDLALNEVTALVATGGKREFGERARSQAVREALANIAERRSAIDLISIEDAEGVTIANSRGQTQDERGPIYLMFDFLKHNSVRDTRVGALRVSDATGAMVVDFMRRLEAPDGTFLGVVRVSVTPPALVSTYSPISAMPGRSYALFTRDGSILARVPTAPGTVGQRLPQGSEWYDVVLRGGGLYEARSNFDQQERIIAVRPLPFSELVVTVSVLRSTALAHWREQSLAIAVCAGLALAIAAFLARALVVQFGRLAENEAALRRQSEALEISNQRFSVALGNMSQGLVVFDREGRIVISNRRYASIYGLKPAQIPPGTPAQDVLRLRAAKGLYAGETVESYVRNSLRRRFTDQRIDRLTDGRSILVNHAACADGGMVVTHEDVTEREQANAQIAHMAMHDELTSLANRTQFVAALEAIRGGIGAAYAQVVLMLVDLDDFKPVNDTFGHDAGDAVLRECARRMQAAAPDATVVARLGGDEFALAFAVKDADVADPLVIAERLIAAIAQPYAIGGQSPVIGACIGVVTADDPALSNDELMRRADLALYAAKAQGANRRRMFEPQMELEALTRRDLASDLAEAIESDLLYLVYQPIVDGQTLEIRQMEALLRWRHPRRGLIPPQEFVRLAEETRQIDRLGDWVLRRACAEAAKWPETVGVAINVSPMQLANEDFAASVLRALADSGVSPRRLEIEITESTLLQYRLGSIAALRDLHAAGVSVALDDFGTGFSSLSYLKQFRFDRLKIDRSFVADVNRDAGSAAIIAATVQLARAFEIEITAEGVETSEQRAALRAAGVRTMQGYLFGWPDTIDDGLPSISAAASVHPVIRAA